MGAWNINFVERFSKPFTRIENQGYKTRSHFSSPPYEGMLIQISAEHWTAFSEMSVSQFAKTLLELARPMDLTRYLKTRRGPKKPPPKKQRYRNVGHVSTAKLLANRKPKT